MRHTGDVAIGQRGRAGDAVFLEGPPRPVFAHHDGAAIVQLIVAKSGDWLFVYDKSNPFGAQTALQVPEGCQTMAVGEGGLIWSASGFNGVKAYQLKDGVWADQGVKLGGYGPKRDLCYYLRFPAKIVKSVAFSLATVVHCEGSAMLRLSGQARMPLSVEAKHWSLWMMAE